MKCSASGRIREKQGIFTIVLGWESRIEGVRMKVYPLWGIGKGFEPPQPLSAQISQGLYDKKRATA
jgi:hypothetical protein